MEGSEVVTIVLDAGGDYGVANPGSASATLIDDEQPPANLLFSDDFESDSSGSWLAQFGANNGIYDASTIFAYDYGAIGLPPAPHSSGTTHGLFVSVNKNNSAGGGSAGINLYPIGQQFSGDYALRFDMYLSVGASSTTEHALAGLDHSGLMTNRFTQSVDTNHTITGGDGLWVGIVTDASDLLDYGAYATTNPANGPSLITNRSAFRYASVLPSPPYAYAGSPSSSGTNQSWADVELSQIGRIVSLKVNQNLILQVTNRYGSDTGNIMLGMNDQFDSIGSVSNFVIFDNVRVVDMSTRITSIEILDKNRVQIDFFSPLSVSPDDFRLQSAPGLSPTVWTDEGAEVSGRPGGLRAVTGYTGDTRFYRIIH